MYCEISVEVFVHPITARIEKNINFDNSGMLFCLYFKSLFRRIVKLGLFGRLNVSFLMRLLFDIIANGTWKQYQNMKAISEHESNIIM